MNAFRKGILAAATCNMAADGPETCAAGYRFGADFVGFAGHFPGHPVLPAIAQVATVIVTAETHAGRPLSLVAVQSAKFLAPISPGDEIRARLRRRAGAGTLVYDATLEVTGKTVTSMRIELAGKEPLS